MKTIEDLVPDGDDNAFEEAVDDAGKTIEILALPSDLSLDEQKDYELDELAEYELRIRIGMAFDQLEQVQHAVQHRAAHLEAKKKHPRGQKANAAAQEDIVRATSLACLLVTHYNMNHRMIHALSPADYDEATDSDPGTHLRVIDLDKDLAIANLTAACRQGDSETTGSWIWQVFQPKTSTTRATDQGLSDCKLLHKYRKDEAVSLKCAEFQRTQDGCAKWQSLWLAPAETVGLCRGQRAYTYKQADMPV
ncbi:hypothetical protein C8Q76DRAFT_633164 [Earliella scabrosa]|nr:hypothetical protein C8Q76DRAFT_633164 [Earliella scabrosa]